MHHTATPHKLKALIIILLKSKSKWQTIEVKVEYTPQPYILVG